MLALIRYFGYIPQLAGVILAAVAFIEGIKAGDPGPEKKQAVMDAMKAGWDTISANFEVKRTFEELAPLIGILIDICVAMYNLFWKAKVA